MTADDIILHIFHLVATSLPAVPRQGFASQAKLYPSEFLTIGILFGLKGGCFPTFYRWLDRALAPPATQCHFGGFPQLLPTFFL